MRNAPFALSPIFLAIIPVYFLIGGLAGHFIALFNMNVFLAAIISGFAPIPFGGYVRYSIAKSFGKFVKADGEVPFAFSYPVRMVIGVIVSVITGYGFITFTNAPITFLTGGLIALATGFFFAAIMTLAMATKK